MASTSHTPTAPGRRYGGRTAEERQAERREQLIAAGLELIGTVGFQQTSIRGILRESGLAERYFYENFASLEALLVAVHEHVHAEVVARVKEATEAAGNDTEARARAGLIAFVGAITTDPRWVKIKMAELGGNAADEVMAFRRRAQRTYAELLVSYSPRDATAARGLQPEVLALSVIASAEYLLDAWAGGQLPMTLDQLVDHWVVVVKGTAAELEGPRA